MKTVLLATALVLTAAAAARADVNLWDNKQTVTVDCAKDKVINISGNKATVTLKGTCDVVNISGNDAKVTGSVATANVSGNSNTLTLDAVDAILVSGNKNTISYKKTVKAKQPTIANPGTDNKVSQVK